MASSQSTHLTLIIDLLENVRWKEIQGKVIEISRLAIVSGEYGGFGTSVTEAVVLEALNHQDMPQPGAEHPVVTSLILRERFPIIRDSTIIQVELRYKRPGGADPTPPGFAWVPSGGAGLEEIETQLDRNGDQITVEHNDVTQGGVIRPLMPRPELEFEWTGQSDSPGQLAIGYVGKTNLENWQLGAPGTWLCMSVFFDIADPSTVPVTYKYSMKFRHKDDGTGAGWNPQVVFTDPETGEPPAGLDSVNGYKVIPWYLRVSFEGLPL